MAPALPFRRSRLHTAALLAAASLNGLLFAEEVTAADGLSEVQVQCDELDSERRASVEARQLGELKTRGGAPGVLKLSCESSRVAGSWSVGGRLVADRSLSRKPEEDPAELLHWLAAMLLETREERARAGIDDVVLAAAVPTDKAVPTRGNEEVPTPAADASPGQPGSAADSAQTEDPDSSATESPSPPPILEPSDADSKMEPTRSSIAPPPLLPNEDPDLPESPNDGDLPRPIHFVAGAAGKYQHWGSELTGSWGPALFTGAQAFGHSTIEAEFSPQFALRRTRDFGATEWTGTLRYCGAPAEIAEGCLGGVYSMLRVSSPSSASGDRATSASGGAEILLRIVFRSRATSYFAALGLRALAQDRLVLLNEKEIATIPRWQLVFALGLRGRP